MKKLITPPASEPVTLAEAKSHLRVDLNDDDTLINALITAARQMAEEYTRRAFITQTWEATFLPLGVPYRGIRLSRPPVQQIVSITVDGQTLDPTKYELLDDWIEFDPKPLPQDKIVIRYNAGYGSAADVPSPIKQAILQIVGHLYENRESQDMPGLAVNLLQPYRVMML
jgi:uncharacterized phiE125 gp8 family phage protein